MPKIAAFEKHTSQYESWFAENKWTYQAELKAVQSLLPKSKRMLEIGVGTGRFAVPTGIRFGVEPSPKMGSIARQQGIQVVRGVAEALPLANQAFDAALMVTTICFVDNLLQSMREAGRVLKENGSLVIGFVDKESPIGQIYLAHQHESAFYKEATFYSTAEVLNGMKKAGFANFALRQTIFKPLSQIDKNEPVKAGYGAGSFVVMRGQKNWTKGGINQ